MNLGEKILFTFLAAILAVGCSRPVLRDYAQPSRTKDQYSRIKRVAIFPFENYSDTKDADKTVDALLATAILEEKVFEEIEETRFVRDSMKKLKITATDILDKEIVRKLADEMNVQAVLYGKIIAFGKGKEKDAGSQVTMDMVMLEPSSGSILWSGNVTVLGGLTAGKIFGVSEGKTDIEVARIAIRRLVVSLADEVEEARDRERKGILSEIKREEDRERARLEQLKAQTGKIQEDQDKAKAEAEAIRQKAAQEAEAVKSDLELQKAAVEAEKAKADAAQQAIDQEKLKIEMERKKIEEERVKLEEERKAGEKLIREQPVIESAPPSIPEPPKEVVPIPETPPATEIPAPPVSEDPAVPAEPVPPPVPAQQ